MKVFSMHINHMIIIYLSTSCCDSTCIGKNKMTDNVYADTYCRLSDLQTVKVVKYIWRKCVVALPTCTYTKIYSSGKHIKINRLMR